ncbi:hypothetical protein NMY22_g1227 [Coprinellus aureogranulatus]|nr:hypothetical protein NMY22_g1227 [Coprinellus aureogranulatus]
MPTHTIHSALIKLFLAVDGSPWNFPGWQDITSVKYGLFPDDDSRLPHGWSRDKAKEIMKYFREYEQLRTEDDKIKFAGMQRRIGNDVIPGRALWRKWVTERYSRDWDIHGRIAEVIQEIELHPLQLMSACSDFKNFPGAASYLPAALDSIAIALFGEDCLDQTGHLQRQLRDPTLILAQRTWEQLRRSHFRDVKRLSKLESIMENTLQALNNGKATKRKLSAAIENVGKWETLASSYSSEEMFSKIRHFRGEVDRIVEGLGFRPKVRVPRPQSPLTSVTDDMLRSLASEEDVSELVYLYDSYFSFESMDDGSSLAVSPHIALSFPEPVGGADPGVEVEAGMTIQQMMDNLGFVDNLPFMFNSSRNIDGYHFWDKAEKSKKEEGSVERFTLHRHQISGVHAIIRNIFTSKASDSHSTGVLCADEVGLGKTIQSIAAVAVLMDVVTRQSKGLRLPPLVESRPFINQHNPLPSLPILVLVPGTLLTQWETELKVALKPRCADLMVYGSGHTNHKEFWSSDGIYASSNHPEHRRIILASHSAILQDYGLLYSSGRTKGRGSRSDGTPDRRSILFTKEMLQQERQDSADLRRAKLDKDEEDSKESDPVQLLQNEISKRLFMSFDGRVIRRTAKSKSSDGEPLIKLTNMKIKKCLIKLSGREYNFLEAVNEASLDAASTANSRNIRSSRFYLQHRMGVSFAREQSEDANGGDIPRFDSLDSWYPVMSTKMDTCARLVQHVLSRDDAAQVEFEGGCGVFPLPADVDPQSPHVRTNKVIIYQEFPLFRPLLQNILTLYGVRSVYIDGRTSYEGRSEVIREFRSNPNCRVLIFSRVGNVGLNLTCANTVIFLDQPWSAQDEQQIRGRIHRHGQSKDCISYQLLALGTADEVLAGISESKSSMLTAFFSRESSQKLLSVLRGHVLSDEGDIADNAEETSRGKVERCDSAGTSARLYPAYATSPSPDTNDELRGETLAVGGHAHFNTDLSAGAGKTGEETSAHVPFSSNKATHGVTVECLQTAGVPPPTSSSEGPRNESSTEITAPYHAERVLQASLSGGSHLFDAQDSGISLSYSLSRGVRALPDPLTPEIFPHTETYTNRGTEGSALSNVGSNETIEDKNAEMPMVISPTVASSRGLTEGNSHAADLGLPLEAVVRDLGGYASPNTLSDSPHSIRESISAVTTGSHLPGGERNVAPMGSIQGYTFHDKVPDQLKLLPVCRLNRDGSPSFDRPANDTVTVSQDRSNISHVVVHTDSTSAVSPPPRKKRKVSPDVEQPLVEEMKQHEESSFNIPDALGMPPPNVSTTSRHLKHIKSLAPAKPTQQSAGLSTNRSALVSGDSTAPPKPRSSTAPNHRKPSIFAPRTGSSGIRLPSVIVSAKEANPFRASRKGKERAP